LLEEQVDDRVGCLVAGRIEAELREPRVLPDQVGDRVLEQRDDALRTRRCRAAPRR
jgi:hypothetical protein